LTVQSGGHPVCFGGGSDLGFGFGFVLGVVCGGGFAGAGTLG
jgi:hypothetical protein